MYMSVADQFLGFVRNKDEACYKILELQATLWLLHIKKPHPFLWMLTNLGVPMRKMVIQSLKLFT